MLRSMVLMDEKSRSQHPIVSNQPKDDLAINLCKLREDYDQLATLSNDKKTWDALSEDKKIENEKAKFEIMQTVNNFIDRQYGITKKNNELSETEKKVAWWRKGLFAFLIIADIALMSVGGYLGSLQLLQLLIPGISFAAMTTVAVITTAIESTMMYSIFKPMLQEGLGIPTLPPKETLAHYYMKRLALMEKMNNKMVNNIQCTLKQGPIIYHYFAANLKSFNQDIKKTELIPFKEPTYKRVGRYCLTGLNFCLSIAGTYFGTIMLLTAVSAALVGTPVGWAIIGTLILAQLLSRLLIRTNSIYNLLNPTAQQHESTRIKLEQFKDRTKGIDNDLNTMQKVNKIEKIEIEEKLRKPSVLKANAKSQECPRFFKPGDSLSNKMFEISRRDATASKTLSKHLL